MVTLRHKMLAADPREMRALNSTITGLIVVTKQATLLRHGVPASTTELPALTGAQKEQSGRKFASGGATTRAQDAAVQIGSTRPAFSQHACRRPQHVQPATPSRLALDAPDLPSRSGDPMADCGCRGVIAYSACGSFCTTEINLTMPARPSGSTNTATTNRN